MLPEAAIKELGTQQRTEDIIAGLSDGPFGVTTYTLTYVSAQNAACIERLVVRNAELEVAVDTLRKSLRRQKEAMLDLYRVINRLTEATHDLVRRQNRVEPPRTAELRPVLPAGKRPPRSRRRPKRYE